MNGEAVEVRVHGFESSEVEGAIVERLLAFGFEVKDLRPTYKGKGRVGMEPRRLWKRYLFLNPLYLSLLSLQRSGLWRFDPDCAQPPTEDVRYS